MTCQFVQNSNPIAASQGDVGDSIAIVCPTEIIAFSDEVFTHSVGHLTPCVSRRASEQRRTVYSQSLICIGVAARALPKALPPHPLLYCRLHPLQTALRNLRRSTARLFPISSAPLLPTHIALPVDRAKEFEALNCQVLAASTDTEECHLAWIR